MPKKSFYTYYLVQFKECNSEFGDYTICETIEEVTDCIHLVDIYLDSNALSNVKISGIPLTRDEYKNLKNPETGFELSGFYFHPAEENHFEEMVLQETSAINLA